MVNLFISQKFYCRARLNKVTQKRKKTVVPHDFNLNYSVVA